MKGTRVASTLALVKALLSRDETDFATHRPTKKIAKAPIRFSPYCATRAESRFMISWILPDRIGLAPAPPSPAAPAEPLAAAKAAFDPNRTNNKANREI